MRDVLAVDLLGVGRCLKDELYQLNSLSVILMLGFLLEDLVEDKHDEASPDKEIVNVKLLVKKHVLEDRDYLLGIDNVLLTAVERAN